MSTRSHRGLIAIVAVVGVILVVLTAASVALDVYVKHHARPFLAQVEQRIGRKVEVRRLSASLFTGLTAENVTVGGSQAPGDDKPLLTIARIDVRPSLLRTLVTLGRRAQVADIRLVNPAINVVRFPDGSLNVDEVAARWRQTAPPPQPSQPMSERTRRIIENARIRNLRIADGRVHFVDRAGRGRVADVTGLDLAVADVGIRRHPSIDLRAAIASAQPNLDLHAKLGAAGSLDRLPPPIESAQLKLARTDLAPLASLLARIIPGFEAGETSADLEMHGGTLRGNAQLAQARFTGGAPFDVTLAADLSTDRKKGDVDVSKLDVAVGNMALHARGRVISLQSEPRFDGLTMESQNLDFDQLRRIYPRLDRALGVQLHGPAQLGARGSGQELTAFVDLTAASIAAPGRFEKPRGTIWRLDVSGRGEKQALAIEQLTLRVAQQSLRAHGTVRLGEKQPLLDLYVDTDRLAIAALTPLVPSLAGMPPIVVSTNAHVTGRAGAPDSMALDVQRLAITSRKTALAGTLTVRNFARPQIDLRAQASYLDTADLVPETKARASEHAPQPSKTASPSPLDHMSGHAVVSAAQGIASGVPFSGLQTDVTMRDGAVHANKLQVAAWGGQIAGDGSDFDVARGPFHLVGRVERIDAEQMLARLGGARKILSGRLSARLDVHGRATTEAELLRSLTGTLDGAVEQAQLLAFNFDDLLVAELVRALPFHLPTQRLSKATNLGTLEGQLRFADGAITTSKPLTATTPEGPVQLAGRFSLDGGLELTGTLQMQPAAASALFANRLRLSEPLPLSLRLAGNIHKPSLSIPNIVDVSKVLVRSAIGGLIPGRQEAKIPSNANEAVNRLKGLFGR